LRLYGKRYAMEFDVVVIGGGPAGSTAGRLLAEWGYSVVLFDRLEKRKPSLAESLPPSTRKLFGFLGILHRLEAARFYRSSGNTVWWGDPEARVERFGGSNQSWGYQVLRSDFDELLLDLAASARVLVRPNATVLKVNLEADHRVSIQYDDVGDTRTACEARFVLDCSGRSGVIARRGFRKKEARYATLAIAGEWRNETGWGLKDPTHTLVEAYPDGWAWSIPLSAERRHFTVMVDPQQVQASRGRSLKEIYFDEMGKTVQFKIILSNATMEGAPWGCDASLYSAETFGGPQFILVGDAASFIDPLSSFGVKKALASAWIAAVVANTCFKKPALRQIALDMFSNRERQVYASHLRQSERYYQEAALRYPTPFWTARAQVAEGTQIWDPDEEELKRDPDVLAAFEALKQSRAIQLQCARDVRVEKRPGIEGNEVVLKESLVSPGLPSGARFLGGVNLPRLLEIAGKHSQVPDLFAAYNRICPPVDLGNFLGTLSVLLAKGILRNLHH
jgi:flavin-dependent dehydrogenase